LLPKRDVSLGERSYATICGNLFPCTKYIMLKPPPEGGGFNPTPTETIKEKSTAEAVLLSL